MPYVVSAYLSSKKDRDRVRIVMDVRRVLITPDFITWAGATLLLLLPCFPLAGEFVRRLVTKM
jgi:hypothetical protein